MKFNLVSYRDPTARGAGLLLEDADELPALPLGQGGVAQALADRVEAFFLLFEKFE